MVTARGRGSSPHTRGARRRRRQPPTSRRIIPAYAGSTAQLMLFALTSEDHPRIRGEHSSTYGRRIVGTGSSPHTRGARGRCHDRLPAPWIIPAYAGSTRRSAAPRTRTPDHPRIRGEHTGWPSTSWRWKGSSPHTRGARLSRRARRRRGRIIPAYAGSTPYFLLIFSQAWDHPRIRGEHAHMSQIRLAQAGSSPHTRGAPPTDDRKRPNLGIIPAYAGSTSAVSCRRGRRWDHPRIRGEHGAGLSNRRRSEGSSPHTRGAH